MAPMWKKLMKNVDLDEPTSCLDHENLGCTQRECEANEKVIDQYREIIESRISATATEKTLRMEETSRKDSCVVLRHGGTCSKVRLKDCELASRKAEQLYKVSTPCLDDHHFKKEEVESVGDLPKVCLQIVLARERNSFIDGRSRTDNRAGFDPGGALCCAC